MFKKSQAAGNILIFITCMVEYYDAMTLMIPKRQALEEANMNLENATEKLKQVKEEVADLESKLEKLIEKFN